MNWTFNRKAIAEIQINECFRSRPRTANRESVKSTMSEHPPEIKFGDDCRHSVPKEEVILDPVFG
jgi:hypothetical protein